MPAPGNSINRYPRGFLSLLDGKTDGRTPQNWTSELSTILDLSQLYLNSFKQVESGSTTAFVGVGFQGASTGTVLLAPPDDEIWWVHNIDVSSGGAALGGGVTIGGHAAINWGNGTTPIKAGGSATFTAGNMPQWGGQEGSPQNIIVLPGWQLGFMCTVIVAGGQVLVVHAWVTKLKI
jgi:hypothetical protein